MKRRSSNGQDVRAGLLSWWREFAERHPPAAGPYLPRIAALEAGEPVVVAAWEVAPHAPSPLTGAYHYRLEEDGTLTPVAPVKEWRYEGPGGVPTGRPVPHIVDWAPVG